MVIVIKRHRITVVIKISFSASRSYYNVIREHAFKFLLFFGDPNRTCLRKQDWQRELNFLKLINLKSFPESWVYFLWNQVLHIWHETFFCFFLNIFPSQIPHFCTVVVGMQMKLSNKCKLIPKEYQINSSYQTVVQFESKLISIRIAKLYYIRTLPITRRVFKIKS